MGLSALDKKLARDLWRLRSQVLAIAAVVASGVSLLVMALTSIEALETTSKAYYERYRFAEVFANVERAPERLADRIAAIPGVRSVETRVRQFALLEIDGFDQPVIGQLVSVPERGQPKLNRLVMRAGRGPAPGRSEEAVVSEPFAAAHGLGLGDRFTAIMDGHKKSLLVVGIALSPEFIYAIAPGQLMPDNERFGVIWMGREALAGAYDLEQSFNDVVLSLLRGARSETVIAHLDLLLDRYGGIGAYDRSDQISHWFLANEIKQQKSMSMVLPSIFLLVAAFLTNMVLARQIAMERGAIGILKAFGYSHWAIAWHYAKMVLVIGSIGVVLGWLLGAWLGRYNTSIYAELFNFPFLLYHPGPAAFAISAIVSLAAALFGALGAVRKAAALPAAEAMRPPAPPLYSRGLGSRGGRLPLLDQPTRMLLRQIGRWPFRSFLTAAGIALSLSVLVMALQWLDSVDQMIEESFVRSQRQDATIGLVERQSFQALAAMEHLPGVRAVEPWRSVSARLRKGHRSRREGIQGVLPDARLNLVYDVGGHALSVPPAGLVISTKLAEVLEASTGDFLTVELLEGRRPVVRVPIVATFETYLGTPAYMDLRALNRLMGEGPSLNGAHILVDPLEQQELFDALMEMPQVSAMTLRRAAIDGFKETMAETLLIFVSFFIIFSGTLTFGVVYNSAQIALSERARELATLRVLGFSRWEISYILLGETSLLTLLSLPLGCLTGWAIAWVIVQQIETELFRVPMVVEPSTFGMAAVVTLVTTALSAAVVRRRLDRLDLVAVLKTRE